MDGNDGIRKVRNRRTMDFTALQVPQLSRPDGDERVALVSRQFGAVALGEIFCWNEFERFCRPAVLSAKGIFALPSWLSVVAKGVLI